MVSIFSNHQFMSDFACSDNRMCLSKSPSAIFNALILSLSIFLLYKGPKTETGNDATM